MEIRLYEYYKGTRGEPVNWGHEPAYNLLLIGNNVSAYGQTEKLDWWESVVGLPCGVTTYGFSLLKAICCILSGHVEYVNYD